MTSLLTVDVFLAPGERWTNLADDARAGLTASPKSLPPVWFYDERGSRLFDQITRLPEYYPTAAEREILSVHAEDIAIEAGAETVVELGSGTSDKTRLLLDAMSAQGTLRRFVPFDVSEETLRAAADDIRSSYGIEVAAVVGDFHRHLGHIRGAGRRLVAFLGGTIGNLTPSQRRRFLSDLHANMNDRDHLLLGADLIKDRARLIAAYDDRAGITAEFNRNVLSVLNHELDADFVPRQFDHVAVWNEAASWIEMRLRSRINQTVHLDRLGLDVDFAMGEELLTEISAKFTPEQVQRELSHCGFVVTRSWTDTAGDFLLTLGRPSS
jgi:dimethylhistidine N-methyltransferase